MIKYDWISVCVSIEKILWIVITLMEYITCFILLNIQRNIPLILYNFIKVLLS